MTMEEKVIARIILSQSGGLTFDKTLIDQSLSQNYVNGFDLYNNNVRSIPNNTQNLTKNYPTFRRFKSPYLIPNKRNNFLKFDITSILKP